jgi:hypothetical protein
LAVSLSEASASVPPALVGLTTKSALLMAAGQSAAVSASVLRIMKGATRAMLLAKLKPVMAITIAVVLGAGTLAYSASGLPGSGGNTMAAGAAKAVLKVADAKLESQFVCLDFQAQGNELTELAFPGDENGDGKLPLGEQTLEGVKFNIGKKHLQLEGTNLANRPTSIPGIKVDQKATRLHFLHGTGWSTDEGTTIGEYIVTREDSTTVTIPIRFGKDVHEYWFDDSTPEPSEAKTAWKGEHKDARAQGKRIRLFLMTWENPKPDQKLKSIDFRSTNTACPPFCVAITAETKAAAGAPKQDSPQARQSAGAMIDAPRAQLDKSSLRWPHAQRFSPQEGKRGLVLYGYAVAVKYEPPSPIGPERTLASRLRSSHTVQCSSSIAISVAGDFRRCYKGEKQGSHLSAARRAAGRWVGMSTIQERLREFYRQLGSTPRAGSAEEALQELCDILDRVEDAMSGIPK